MRNVKYGYCDGCDEDKLHAHEKTVHLGESGHVSGATHELECLQCGHEHTVKQGETDNYITNMLRENSQ